MSEVLGNGCKGAVAFLVIALLSWPGVSRAERHSTPHEKAAINRAARHAYADRYFRVTVSDIEVSTVNRRWATAVVALFRRKEPRAPATQEIQEWFFRAQRGWVAWFSTAMPDVEMPTAVAEDLGIAEPESLLETIVKWAMWGVLGGIVLLVLGFFSRSSAPGQEGGRSLLGGRRGLQEASSVPRRCARFGAMAVVTTVELPVPIVVGRAPSRILKPACTRPARPVVASSSHVRGAMVRVWSRRRRTLLAVTSGSIKHTLPIPWFAGTVLSPETGVRIP